MNWTRFGLAAMLAVVLYDAPALARQDDQQPPPPAFPQLFPHPSGQNGYEELVLAGDLARSSKLLDAAQEPGSLLAAKRAAIDDPPVRRARDLLRVGLSKPIISPHFSPDFSTVLPEMALFRNLARMLAVEEYVLLADGKVGAAIDDMRDGLRLSYAIQKQFLIAGLVGIAIDAIVVKPVALHLEQLSVRDCDRLMSIARDWVALPDPTIDLIAAEGAGILRSLDRARANPQKFLDDMGLSQEAKDQAQQVITDMTRQDPRALDKLAAQMAGMVSARYAAFQMELRKAYYERTPLPPIPRDTMAGMALNMLGLEPSLERATDKFVTDQAQVQLLAVHAAIRRYRWEHDALPGSLSQLKLRALATDPFTGLSLVYRVTGAAYELYSAGPFDRGVGADTPPKRIPVYVPWRNQ